MKVVLLSPAGAMHRFTGNFKKAIHYAPLTLTILAGVLLEHKDVEVKIYDETIEAIPLDLEADIIMMTVITGTAPRCYDFATYYRKKGITVILGGVHPTLLPEEAKQFCDSVLIGFGEIVIPKMLADYKNKVLKPYYNSRELDEKLVFGTVRRDLLPTKKYITNNSLEATRGCSNACSFCAVNAVYDNKVYKKPVAEVIQEIESLDAKMILFVDVNLIADRSYAIELFKAMAPLKKWWFGLSTADVVKDDELFKWLVKSGCKGLLIGFESVTAGSLAYMNKYRNDVVDYHELMKKMHANGISINGTFCFGTDEDDQDVFKRTVEMVLKLKIDLPRYSILTPFPGTPLYAQINKENRIIDRHWAMYDVQHCVYQPKKMSVEALEAGLMWAWRETYTNMNIIKRINRPHITFPLSISTNRAYQHYADKLEVFNRAKMIDNSDIPKQA